MEQTGDLILLLKFVVVLALLTDTAEQIAAKMNKPWKTLEAQTH